MSSNKPISSRCLAADEVVFASNFTGIEGSMYVHNLHSRTMLLMRQKWLRSNCSRMVGLWSTLVPKAAKCSCKFERGVAPQPDATTPTCPTQGVSLIFVPIAFWTDSVIARVRKRELRSNTYEPGKTRSVCARFGFHMNPTEE